MAAMAAVLAQLFEPIAGHRLLAVVGACAAAASVACVLCGRRAPRVAWALALIAALVSTRAVIVPSEARDVASLAETGPGQGRSYIVEARVLDVAPSTRGGARWLVEATALGGDEPLPARGRSLVYIRMHAPDLAPGARVELTSKFRRISSFGNPGELDWPGWNARRGVFVSAYVWDGADVKVVASGSRSFRDRLEALRARITSAALEGQGRGGVLVAALITGERRLLSEADARAVTAAGLAHVLAISGLNLSLVGGAATLLAARLLLRTRAARAGMDTMRFAALFGLALTLAYAAISGGGVSVARAALMAVVVAAAVWRGRADRAAQGLSSAALVVCAAMPGVAREAGFQLSFVAVAAILLYGARVRRSMDSRLAIARTAVEVSCLCWAVSTPIVAQHFGRIALYGAPATLLTAPLVSGIVGSGLVGAALVAVDCPTVASLVFTPAAWMAEAVLDLSHWIASAPAAELRVVSPGPTLTVLVTLLPLAALLRSRLALPFVSTLAMAAVALAAVAYHERHREDALDAHFLSVGQGDAAVLRLPGGGVAVVDGGPPGRGGMIVVPALRRLHIARIDYLIVTHAQDDHFGGVGEILDEVEVGEIWSPSGSCDVESFRALRDRASALGVRWLEIGSAPLPLRVGPGWSLGALWPRDDAGACDENNRSVVVAVDFANRRVLLSGDVEAEAEAALVREQRPRLDADVMTAPHHGSRTSSSSSYVGAASPTWAIASAGRDNRYGFPRPETVARYEKEGATFLSTATVGAVHARIERGGDIVVRVGPSETRTAPR
jgi:competence protein ComEC